MIIDIVVGAVVLISAIISFLRGFIREVLTIAGVVGGLAAAIFFGPKLSPVFRSWLDVTEDSTRKLFDIVPMGIVADICAYASIFILVVIIISVISHFTAGAAKAMGLGPIDRTLGVIFGIVRAVILLALLYLPFHLLMTEDAKAKYFADSKTHLYIEKTADFMVRFLPSSKDVKDKVEDVADGQIKKKLFENDILYNKDAKPAEKPAEKNEETGYKKDERKELEDLMEDQPTVREPTVNQ
ncbi:MAG TPA: CvpA family protein [Alphaproteobacteria bacterium]|nr:CvpA family protein [Alphaproteobacteria bacterium]